MTEPSDHRELVRRRKRRRSRQTIVAIWSEWRVEIVVVIVVLLAIFLLIEHEQIRQAVVQGLQGVDRLATKILEGLSGFIRDTTLSELIAYVLLLAALAFGTFRLRWRLMRLTRLQSRVCPRCGGGLYRIHRHKVDRLLSLYLPVRRYRCQTDECRWEGLRIKSGVHAYAKSSRIG